MRSSRITGAESPSPANLLLSLALAALGFLLADLHTLTGLDRFRLFGIRFRTDGYNNAAYLTFVILALWVFLHRRWRGLP